MNSIARVGSRVPGYTNPFIALKASGASAM
jgi:hypothetical protein